MIKYDIYKHIIDIFFIEKYYALQKSDGQFIVARDRHKRDLHITADLVKSAVYDKEIVLGTYAISKINECQWLVLDFDRAGEADKLRSPVFDTYKKALNYGLNPYMEFSGNKGYHLWVFFDRMPSDIVWKAAQVLGAGISGEIFPRQPYVNSVSPYGSLVRLPGCMNRKSNVSTQWLQSNMIPARDQLTYVTKLKKTSANKIESLAANCNLNASDSKKNISIDPTLSIDITSPLFKITTDRPRHTAQYSLIMKCLEAGYDYRTIIQLGSDWLDYYSGTYKNDFRHAMSDFDKALKYCEAHYDFTS
jgi:hypothetical protein